MADINTRKITDNDIILNGVQSLPDRPSGTPDEIKKEFDAIADEVIKIKVNGLIDDFLSKTGISGADNIGCKAISGLRDNASGTVYQMLTALQEGLVNATLGAIADRSITEGKLDLDAVMTTVLTGYAMASAGEPTVANTDTLKVALGKIVRKIKNIIDGVAIADKASNYVAGGNIESALATKQGTLSFDTTPTTSSGAVMTSGALKPIFDALTRPISLEKTADYTLILTDVNKVIRANHATNEITITIPLNSSVAFPTDTEIAIIKMGAGVVTIACVDGVTINGEDYTTDYAISEQYGSVALKKIGTNAWVLVGGFE